MEKPRTATFKRHRSPGRPTRKQAEARNNELLDKALDLFLENGFERTTIEAITAAVGMAKRTVYARYGDKDTLFRTALQRAIDEWIVPIERLREAEGEDFEASLLEIGRILVGNILSREGLRLMRITNAESIRMPEIGEHSLRRGTGPTVDYLADLFHRRLPTRFASPADARTSAYAFVHLVAGGPANIVAWGVQLSEDEVERQTRNAVRLFLHGILH
ncbi:TetR/AcrR family transcriptional regulator [Novosphingobium sp. TH158]|uniref:TetR/AcrR family transcriptional regulator n=1 Tax=Novosphingobium sp. TH158 TaxID=2067455 RepID=UPI000C79D3BE|nr:TetR/AcrR family transcriptional regulator [Novosphingobium sp. TH158]PLK26219.1 TetR/AcrR family transcriptional regulator [Novosphingobium sp. TH158]